MAMVANEIVKVTSSFDYSDCFSRCKSFICVAFLLGFDLFSVPVKMATHPVDGLMPLLMRA